MRPAAPPEPVPAGDGTVAPRSLGELFLVFTRMALQGFGGVLPIAQRELVERTRWMTREQFVEMLATAQVLPGPNVVNLALMFGDRCFGVRGAVTALGGMLGVPLIVVMALTVAYAELSSVPAVAGALRGMGAVAAGLILGTAFKLSATLRTSRLGQPVAYAIATVTAIAIGALRWPLLWVFVGLGTVAIALAWRAWGERRE